MCPNKYDLKRINDYVAVTAHNIVNLLPELEILKLKKIYLSNDRSRKKA